MPNEIYEWNTWGRVIHVLACMIWIGRVFRLSRYLHSFTNSHYTATKSDLSQPNDPTQEHEQMNHPVSFR